VSEIFTKETVRDKHLNTVKRILNEGKGAEEITNYLMSKIGTVLSYERRKYERRIALLETQLYQLTKKG
jgi:hypothetical protein